jgi:hypothetical protein
MRFYHAADGYHSSYHNTLKDAHSAAMTMNRNAVMVTEVEVPTDKANIRRLLQNDGGTEQQLRYWNLTARGALCELKFLD